MQQLKVEKNKAVNTTGAMMQVKSPFGVFLQCITNRQTDGQPGRQTDRQTDRQMDGRMDGWTDMNG